MRILERLDEIYAIGATRPGYSELEDAAHELAAKWMRDAELEVSRDEAGNLFGRRGGGRMWTGSHLDSVPDGGRFDGVLGVVAGLEAVERAADLQRPVAVVAFRDEERGFGGSLARVAQGALPELYVEAHVEQGPRLLEAGAPLGVVTAIVGVARGEVVLDGAAGHAGTTPMAGRRDALCAAADLVLHVRDAALSIPESVATVGVLAVEPGAANVIPERAVVSVDARAPDRARLDELVAAIGFEPSLVAEPAPMDPGVRAALRAELDRRGLPAPELVSGAGHDAGVLAAAGVRCGMLFVRSGAEGISHSPAEWTEPEDVTLCVDVLEGVLRSL